MTENTEFGADVDGASQPEGFPSSPFAMADLPEIVQAAAGRLNWTELMPVQVQTIPVMLSGQDVMVQSQTGSGKTGAFLLPILNRIDPQVAAPQALVLCPTRELAVQVSRDAEELGHATGVHALPIYGGVGYKPQIQGLESGAQLIIGTPGRILDHLLKGSLNLDRLKVLVFDEADRMLSMGFYPDMKQLQRYLPRGLQSAMFSATYPGHVKRLAQQFLKEPVFVTLSQEQVHVTDVLHVLYKVPAMQKSRMLVKIIELENPASAIIFCNTKADVHFVSTVLRRFGYDVGEISADLSQGAREEVLEKLRLNKLKFLVATDVAARGIDIHELSHVFQYQPPQDHEAYVHRTGRTGRAGAAGVAISFVSGMEEIELEQISKKFSIPMEERQLPAEEELETLISQRAVFLLESRLRSTDNIQKERMQRFMNAVGDLASNEESRALLAMLVDEFYQQTFHAPLEQPSGRMLDLVRTVPTEVRPAPQGESGRTEGVRPEGPRPEGEKRRRKRSRKKSGGGPESRDMRGVASRDVIPADIDSDAGPDDETIEPAIPIVLESETPAVPHPVAQSASVDDAGDDSEDEGAEGASDVAAPAPKKRRRRRSRKSGAARAETMRESGAAQDGGPLEEQAAVAPEGRDDAAHDAPVEERRESNPSPARNGRSRRGKPAEAPVEPAKPRKKIFLE